jgi:FkbM family methyltransferase
MMRNLLNKFRPCEKHFPTLACVYRTVRDAWIFQRQRAQVTPYGFKLMGNQVMQAGDFEREETSLIKDLLEGAEVFVDVGANIGFYTCLALASGKYTLAIEPLAQNVEYLYANLEANGWKNVEIYPVGLADRPGLATLYGGNTGASFVSGWANSSPLWRRTISVSTLDILLGGRFEGKQLLIKVDVEGGEYDLLQGASETLKLLPAPVWMMEITLRGYHPSGLNPNYTSTFEVFWRHGYQAWTINHERKTVSPADVKRWMKFGKSEFGTGNYLFTKP